MGGDGGGGVPGGGDGGDGGGGGGGGRFGKLLSRVAAILAFLGPILKVIGVISDVVEAFVAPLAILLLRLLQPVLVAFLRILPIWLDINDAIISVIDGIMMLVTTFARSTGLLDSIKLALNGIETLLEKTKDFIGTIKDRIPKNFGPDTGVVEAETSTEQAAVQGAETGLDALGALGITPGGPLVNIALKGGLDALVDRGDRDKNVNFTK
jgi:hypothetical protein